MPHYNLRLYNTLSKEKENFEPLVSGQVGIYLCGPTVYAPAHIGHMVGPVIFDTLKRFLVYCGYQVTWVVNITDVDDKLIVKSRERGIPMAQLAVENTMDYMANLKSLGVDQIDHMPRATECMAEIIQFIQDLIAKGFAYASGGDVFFDVAKDAGYGKLSNRKPDEQQGEGGGAASRKRSAGDFALWKSAKADEPSWDSPWGPGRPGWHIECSAMSRRILGESFDIHGGGLDLMFPHHENEIAQSECCHGKPMVKYWLHNGLMKASAGAGKVGGRNDREEAEAEATVDTKISRSKGAGGLAALIAKHSGEKLRFFLLRTHYRSTVTFGDEEVAEAGIGLDTFLRFFDRFQRVTGKSFYNAEQVAVITRRAEGEFDPGSDELLKEIHNGRTKFLAALDDDFNTGAAASELFEVARQLNKFIDVHQLEEQAAAKPAAIATLEKGVRTLRELTAILGLFRQPQPKQSSGGEELIGKLMALFLELRQEARQKKDFALSDRIRNGLTAAGVTVEDRKGGTEWRV